MKFTIIGAPIRGNRYQGLNNWRKAIIEQTKHIDKINYPCSVEVEFILQENQHPKDRQYGPDVDNLLKPFLDKLKETVLNDDSQVFKVVATKRVRRPGEQTGAIVIIEKYDKIAS